MKKIVLTAKLLVLTILANAQSTAYDELSINNIKAGVNSQGAMFWDFMNGKFEVPKGSGAVTIYANTLWIGGIDASANLRIAAQTYRQTGNDFWPGPLDSSGSTDSTTMAGYNKLWKLKQCDITAYTSWINGGMPGPSPVDSITLNTIVTWPAFGPDGGPLAPFADMNTNGTYDPSAGDYPLIKGDQAIFFVFNDKGDVHTESGGLALGLEIQCMAYAYSCPDDSSLYNTIFTNYKVINKSSSRIDSTYIGNWTDFDIGAPLDDFIGCDVSRSAYYGYNGDSADDSPPAGQVAYGLDPPAQAVVFLAGPYSDPNGLDDLPASAANGMNYGDSIIDNERLGLGHFMSYYNGTGPTGTR
jgi:hypothetical protein